MQGVGFRYFVRDLAQQAALAGWVRNREDGAVECILQGSRKELERAEYALGQGPPWARVSAVEATWKEPEPELAGFRVLG